MKENSAEQVIVTYIDCEGGKHTSIYVQSEMNAVDAMRCCYDGLANSHAFHKNNVLDAMEEILEDEGRR